VAHTRSRRSVLGLVAGGLVALAAPDRGAAARLRGYGDICRKDGDCESGYCAPKDAAGRQRCGCVDGAPCGANGVCVNQTCVDNGGCTIATRCISVIDCPSGCSGESICDQTVEGAIACIDYSNLVSCTDVDGCTTSADCAAGWVCIPDKCCDHPVCVPACGYGVGTASVAATEVGVAINP
jgi:hypothetical protein